MRRREFRYSRRLPTLQSPPLILGRGGDLWVLRTKVPRRRPQRRVPEPLASLKESVEEAQPEVENAPGVAAHPEDENVPEGLNPKDGNPGALLAQYRTGGSERPSSIVMGNHNERENDHEEIATNYV